jgi:ABC-type amino acid transport system permease subunit
MRVSILGAGAIAYGTAAYLAQAGHDPMLWSPSGQRTAALAAGEPLVATNAIEGRFAPRIAASCAEAVTQADAVLVALPGYGHKAVLQTAGAHVREGQLVIGRTEAVLATGMRRWEALRLVVLSQALRAMTPVFFNQLIIVFQDTSLVYVVALRDFMTAASVVAARDGRPTEMCTLVAVVYLVICFSLSKPVELCWKARS